MNTYAATRRETRTQDQTTAMLRKAIGRLSATKRKELCARAATELLSDRAKLQAATDRINAERPDLFPQLARDVSEALSPEKAS